MNLGAGLSYPQTTGNKSVPISKVHHKCTSSPENTKTPVFTGVPVVVVTGIEPVIIRKTGSLCLLEEMTRTLINTGNQGLWTTI